MKTVAKSDSKYSAPKLTVYGDMVKLTAGGSGGPAEDLANQEETRDDPTRP